MKFVGFTGTDIGFGIGTTAGSATALVIDSSNNVGMSSLAGSYSGGSAYVCVNNTIYLSQADVFDKMIREKQKFSAANSEDNDTIS